MSADVANNDNYFPILLSTVGAPTFAYEATASDLSPWANWRSMAASNPWAKVLAPSCLFEGTIGNPANGNGSAAMSVAPDLPVIIDAWFSGHLKLIADAQAKGVWSDDLGVVHVSKAAAENAQFLVAHFAGWPKNRRPNLAFDMDGRVNFTAKTGNFYLHLTYEDEGYLNWYARVDGKEISEDEAPFDGTGLPVALRNLARPGV